VEVECLWKRLWRNTLCNIKKATVLVQGAGRDVIYWARLKPKKIIATDLLEFKKSWLEISAYCKK